MSAPVADEVLRELGAEHRQFRSVRHALLWYRDELARRLRSTRQGFEVGAGPCSQDEQDVRAATFAAIAQCLRANHPADVRGGLSGERIAWLVTWYETRYGDGIWLSERAGVSRWAFMRHCRRTERLIRGRMQWAGLIYVEQ